MNQMPTLFVRKVHGLKATARPNRGTERNRLCCNDRGNLCSPLPLLWEDFHTPIFSGELLTPFL